MSAASDDVPKSYFGSHSDVDSLNRDMQVLRACLEAVTFKEMSESECEAAIRQALSQCESTELRDEEAAALVGFVAQYVQAG
jgi:hypothetical protein